MRYLALFLLGLAFSYVVAAAKAPLRGNRITTRALEKLLGKQALPALQALQEGKVVITAVHEDTVKPDFDLYIFDRDEKSVVDILKAAVNRQEDNIGYIFMPTAGEDVGQHEYFYYTDQRLEWIEWAGEKINMQLRLDEVKYVGDAYSLDDAWRDNRFYVQRYVREDQSSVRYLKELRDELNGKLSEELRDELRRHNLGEILVEHESLAEIAAYVEPAQQRQWQKALMALKAETTAEALVAGVRKEELKREDFAEEQITAAERVVRLKNSSIATRNKHLHGRVHFYAFRIPQAYLHNLLDAYAKDKQLNESEKQELMTRLLRGKEINYHAVKFGQTDSSRAAEQAAQQAAKRSKIKTADSTASEAKLLQPAINLDRGKVDEESA